MVQMSKELFEKIYTDVDCHYLLHPWGKGCITSLPVLFKDSLIGSVKFYSMVYLIQILMRGKKMRKKEQWLKMGNYYIRSILFGQFVAGTASIIGCIVRKLNGNKFKFNTFLFVPFTLNGLFIYLEPPSRRGLVINLFVNLYIEYWLRRLERAAYIKITKIRTTALFMLGSALLFYLMRLEGDKKERTQLFWLFTPDKVRRKTDDSNNVCPHQGSCHKYIFKGTATYFALGLAFTVARLILPRIRSPMTAIASLRTRHLKLAMFFGSYIGIYRAVICYLCRKRGCDSAIYALPAGCLAGLSFIFSPSLGIAIGAMTGAMKLYSTILYEKKLLPARLPLPELLYCICQGTLFSARVFYPEECPSYIFNLLAKVSNNRSEWIYSNYKLLLDKALEQS
ncbi:transmembrane protein 135 isoform X2 [Bombyx mori]|uniref:Transmembrane protein 135 N-terminal domain-containing protein n=2 Tax=Bombyx mori TaxID=7091 RepID=A0A8R2ANS2_BOMMO|nr:transmembrane protein 135 isoform X1 [Bombyx mori]